MNNSNKACFLALCVSYLVLGALGTNVCAFSRSNALVLAQDSVIDSCTRVAAGGVVHFNVEDQADAVDVFALDYTNWQAYQL